MRRLAIILALIIIIPSRTEVQVGQSVSISVQGAARVDIPAQLWYVEGDASVEGRTLTFEDGPTHYATFRAVGPGDVTFPGGQVVRVQGAWHVWMPVAGR